MRGHKQWSLAVVVIAITVSACLLASAAGIAREPLAAPIPKRSPTLDAEHAVALVAGLSREEAAMMPYVIASQNLADQVFHRRRK